MVKDLDSGISLLGLTSGCVTLSQSLNLLEYQPYLGSMEVLIGPVSPGCCKKEMNYPVKQVERPLTALESLAIGALTIHDDDN